MAESRDNEKKAGHPHGGRNRWLYIGSVVILVLVVVTFVGAPVVSSAAGSGRLVFGRYGREDIVYQPGNFFARQYEAIAQSLRDSGNDADLELQLRIAWREAFNRTILHTATLQHAEKAGLDVSVQRVDELIASDPRFRVNGRFDSDAFERIGSQERFSLREFHREGAIFDQVVRDVLTGTKVSSTEREFVAAMSGPERSFDLVRFPFTDFPESEVESFATANADFFTRLDLAVVTLATEEEAQQIREQALQPGNPMGDLARTYSRDLYADQDGQMGEIYGYELQQELINPEDLATVIALAPGEISDPVETTAGWAFYEMLSPPVAFDRADPDMIRTARTYMQNFELGRIQDYVTSEAERFAEVARGSDLAGAAAAEGFDVLSTPFFPINYGNNQLFGQLQSAQVPDLSDAAFRESFFTTAFSLDEEEISEPVVLRQSVLVMQLREERDARAEDAEFIQEYYDLLVRQFQSDEIEGAFIDEERLDDNFAQSFNRFVLGVN
jgi:peptidyl-prolyl cis-trans isomerase D